MSTPHDQTAIRNLAHWLWERRGRPEGTALEDWLEAERQLQSRVVDHAVRASFPASDPPASVLPDQPPANADAQWEAADAHPERPVAPVRPPVKEANPALERASRTQRR